MTLISDLAEVGIRARRRVAYRLLPFVFLIYVVNFIDRVNVSFANLRMSADLGFSDRVYGLGVGMFYLTYVLFEIPGAIIVERWSARKWIARIMISWGVVTILTGFVHSAGQFYAARFFLGLAEASFFPGMIVYLTHWFCSRDRARAIACLYIAVPAASLIGSPIAGWLLGVHWWSLGGMALAFHSGRHSRHCPRDRDCLLFNGLAFAGPLAAVRTSGIWLVGELQTELQAKKKIQEYTILQAFCDRRVRIVNSCLVLGSLSGFLGNIYWIPTFVKRLSGFSDRGVTSLLIIPALIGIAGMLTNGWHSDKSGERRLHSRDTSPYCGIDVWVADRRCVTILG